MSAKNREAWLTAAVKPLNKLIASATELDPAKSVAVSCGWPGGKSVNKVIGQCWTVASANGLGQIFISPKLTDPVMVLDTLLHELVHAADDCEHGHKGPFAKACKQLGLVGKPTENHAGPELAVTLAEIAAKLGEYPHAGITPGTKIKKDGTRMLKLECPECGYIVRTTQKWINVGLPVCGTCDAYFEEAS